MNALGVNDAYALLPEAHPFEGWKPILGEGPQDADVTIIRPHATAWDAGANRPFMGKDGVTIRQVLLEQGRKPFATSVVPFFGGRGQTVRKVHAEAAAQLHRAEVERAGVQHVLLFGVNAARWSPIFGVEFDRFQEVAGRVFETNGYRVGVTHATMAVASSPGPFKDFQRLLKELFEPTVKRVSRVREAYLPINRRGQALSILRGLSGTVALDVESTGTNAYTDAILTLNLSWEEGKGYAFPWTLFDPDTWADLLTGASFVTQNGQFDAKILATHGVRIRVKEDTMLMHSLLDETTGTHSMEQMSFKYLGIDKWGDTVDYAAFRHGLRGMVNPPGIDASEPPSQDFETVGRYGARDTDITLRLANHFRPQVAGREICKVLHRAQNALIAQEHKGIRIDRDAGFALLEEVEAAIHDKEAYLQDTYELQNPNSVPQVKALLYDRLGVPVQKKQGKVTTDNKMLAPFMEEFPAIRDILEYRSLVKCRKPYLHNILLESERDGRYHPEIRLAATETGRVTERFITLIPRPDAEANWNRGKQYQARLRSLFVPDEGQVLIGADYSQLEVRMAAHLSGDPVMIDDINNDIDFHSVNAIAAFKLDIPLEPYDTLKKRVQAEHDFERTLAKIATFASLYGGSAASIAMQTGASVEVAQAIIDALYGRYQMLGSWQEGIKETARRSGSITTPWGRTRRFVFNQGMSREAEAEQLRAAINFPIQAHSTDMNSAAFATAYESGIDVLWPLHDAIYAQAPEDRAEETARRLTEIMESVIRSALVFKADTKIGPNWMALE